MHTTWKYTLKITDEQTLHMPKGAQVLSVANQAGQLCLWAEVDTDQPFEDREFEIHGTGNPMSPTVLPPKKLSDYPTTNTFCRVFIGTVVIDPFVWHVYESV